MFDRWKLVRFHFPRKYFVVKKYFDRRKLLAIDALRLRKLCDRRDRCGCCDWCSLRNFPGSVWHEWTPHAKL